jgi:CTP synthase
MTKFIVVAGGVISGVGKGVATASIGKILQEYGFSVTAIKIDPYINCDAGTLRPTEHGEVWVTEDGGEIDQDLGNYERFLGQNIPKTNNITTGQIYKTLIEKERKGEFLGETVQFIPHVTEEIKNRIKKASQGYDIALIEIGGTVGDYENIPFLFAVKSLGKELGKDSVIFILVSYLPIPSHIEEMKTKPTQLSIKLLQENGIQPDFILCRGRKNLDEVRKRKIETYANIESGSVISMPDVIGKGTVNTIYVIPTDLEKEKLGTKILKGLDLKSKKEPDWAKWEKAVENLINPKKEVDIAIIGKYLDIGDYKLTDSYISINEALKHASANNQTKVNIHWIDSKDLENNNELQVNEKLKNFKGMIIPGGFGSSGVEGKIKAIEYCRKKNIPFLGLCYGLQLAVVEFARNVCNMNDANTTEINPNTKFPVVDILPEQREVTEKGATMRLGAYEALLKENTLTRKIYNNSSNIFERHRHRYEVNPEFHNILQEKGLIFSGMSPNKRLVEFIELPNHKFFIATQAHPEFKSSLLKPAPLFDGFVKACIE